jgi:hypothetical protein
MSAGFPGEQLPNQLRRADVDALRRDCDKHRIIRHLAAKVNQPGREQHDGTDQASETPTRDEVHGAASDDQAKGLAETGQDRAADGESRPTSIPAPKTEEGPTAGQGSIPTSSSRQDPTAEGARKSQVAAPNRAAPEGRQSEALAAARGRSPAARPGPPRPVRRGTTRTGGRHLAGGPPGRPPQLVGQGRP